MKAPTTAFLWRRILELQSRVGTVASGSGGAGITQLTGDVTAGPGSGSQVATIPNDTVSNAQLANTMPEATFKMREVASGTGNPVDGTPNEASLVLDQADDPFVRRSALTGGTPGEQVGIALSAENTVEFDDFIGDNKWSYNVGTAAVRQAAEAGHPGIARLSSTGGNTQSPLNTANGYFHPSDFFTMVKVVRPQGHANAAYYTGAWGTISFTPNDAIWVEALTTDTNWFLVTRSGGSQTRVDTGVAITNNTWYEISIYRKDGSTIGCTINGSSEVTSTTNIPSNPLSVFDGLNVSSGTQSFDLDFWSVALTGLARY